MKSDLIDQDIGLRARRGDPQLGFLDGVGCSDTVDSSYPHRMPHYLLKILKVNQEITNEAENRLFVVCWVFHSPGWCLLAPYLSSHHHQGLGHGDWVTFVVGPEIAVACVTP